MTKIRNAYFLGNLLAPLGGMSDEEHFHASETTDPDDADSMKSWLRSVLKPNFDRYDDPSQQLIRENFRYFLTADIDYWDRLYEMWMPPIDLPADPRQFFVWLWEVLFPGEDYRDPDVDGVEVVNDVSALDVLRARR
jgi:hypothetical protein